MDFLRVSKNTKLQTRVPLHFINEDTCAGVKLGGGIIAHSMTELEISCLPKDLPEYLEVDMEEVELGQTLHISDIKLPKGVESGALSHGEDHDLPIAAVNKPKAAAVEEEEVAEDLIQAMLMQQKMILIRMQAKSNLPLLTGQALTLDTPVELIVGLGNPGRIRSDAS